MVDFKIVHILLNKEEGVAWCGSSHETIFDFHYDIDYDQANCWQCRELYKKHHKGEFKDD